MTSGSSNVPPSQCTPKDETTLDYKRLDPNQFKEDTKPDAKPADDAKPGPPA